MKVIILLIAGALLSGRSFSQMPKESTAATAKRIKNFYTFYILEQEGMPNKKRLNDTLNEYCTAAFLKRMRNDKEAEADILLNVQDFDKNWVNSFTVTKESNSKEEQYKVCFWENYSKENHCVTVVLKQETGKWKIDKVIY